MATIYSGAPSPSRFPFAAHTHYTSNADAAAQIQMQWRYGAAFADNQLAHSPPRLPSPSLTPPPGATLGLLDKQLYDLPQYGNQGSLYMMSKMYQPQPPAMEQPQTEALLVSPGVPTPVELSIYEVKQPTGFLHVTIGNQTVEFLDGVANMPQKR